jgi:hypothetical protein
MSTGIRSRRGSHSDGQKGERRRRFKTAPL